MLFKRSGLIRKVPATLDKWNKRQKPWVEGGLLNWIIITDDFAQNVKAVIQWNKAKGISILRQSTHDDRVRFLIW
jgi:hypothetical protein